MDERTFPSEIIRHRFRALFFASALLAAAAGAVSTATAVAAWGPQQRALGLGRAAFSMVFESAAGDAAAIRWRCEAGEWALFEIDGLNAGAFAVEARRAEWGVIAAASMLSSPVGDRSELGAALLAGDGPFRVAWEANLELLGLHGCRREFLLTLGVDAVVRLSSRLSLRSRVGGVRAAGTRLRGADASLHVVTSPARGLCGLAGIEISRNGAVACGVSSRLRLARRVNAAVGYDEGTGAVSGALSVGVRSIALEAGASVHPVLGMSRGVFISWERGVWEP